MTILYNAIDRVEALVFDLFVVLKATDNLQIIINLPTSGQKKITGKLKLRMLVVRKPAVGSPTKVFEFQTHTWIQGDLVIVSTSDNYLIEVLRTVPCAIEQCSGT